MSNNYFVFCWCPKNWLPRAIFVPLENLDLKISEEIDKLIKIGPIVREIYKWEGNCGSLDKFIIKDGASLDKSCELAQLLGTWQHLSDNGFECFCDYRKNYYVNLNDIKNDKSNKLVTEDENKDEEEEEIIVECKCPDYMKNSFGYYINDENRHLSPLELYEKIKSMTSYDDKSFTVQNCIVLTDFEENKSGQKPLRFFYKNKEPISKVNLEKILTDNFNLTKIIIAGNDLSSSGYGFAYQEDKTKEGELVDHKFGNGEFSVFFDRG